MNDDGLDDSSHIDVIIGSDRIGQTDCMKS